MAAHVDEATLERLEDEDAEHESPGVTIEQVQADIDKAMGVQRAKEVKGVAEQREQQADEAAAQRAAGTGGGEGEGGAEAAREGG